MHEYTVDAFANRDEPMPVMRGLEADMEGGTISDDSTHKPGKRERLKNTASNLKENLKITHGKSSESHSSTSMQDRLIEKYSSKFIFGHENGC